MMHIRIAGTLALILSVVCGTGLAGEAPPPPPKAPMSVKSIQKEGDKVRVIMIGEQGNIGVESPSGIGSAVIALEGKAWPKTIELFFLYSSDPAPKGFERLEGFKATLINNPEDPKAAKEVDAKKGKTEQSAIVTLTMPEGAGALGLMKIEWVDAYR